MADSARVTSIDAVRDFRAAMIEYGETTRSVLGEANATVQRTITWLESTAMSEWKRQVKVRERRVMEVKLELERAKMNAAAEGSGSTMLERKAYERALRDLEESQRKVEACRRWARQLDRELIKYTGQVQQLDHAVEATVPRAVARLDEAATRLEQYIALQAPESAGPRGSGEADAASAARSSSASTATAASTDAAPLTPPEVAARPPGTWRDMTPSPAAREAADRADDAWLDALGPALTDEAKAQLEAVEATRRMPAATRLAVLVSGIIADGATVLVRGANASGRDSGWTVFVPGPAPTADEVGDEPTSRVAVTSISRLLAQREDWRAILGLPPGTVVVLGKGGVLRAVDGEDRPLR